MALTAILAGVPISAKDIIHNALNEAYGEGTVSLEELAKDKIRSRVRLAGRNVNIILVVLDRVLTDSCKDIELGLYSSDKFYSYEDDAGLVRFLNEKYNLNMDVPKEDTNYISTEDDTRNDSSYDAIIEDLESKLEDKDMLIRILNNQLAELNSGSRSGCSSDLEIEIDALRKENIMLKGQILDSDSSSSSQSEQIKKLESDIEVLSKKCNESETKRKRLLSDYQLITDELTKLKVAYSKQTSVIRDRDVRISEYEKKIADSGSYLEIAKSQAERVTSLESEIDSLRLENSTISRDLAKKDKDVLRYLRELEELRVKGTNSEEVETLKRELREEGNENSSLRSQVEELNLKIKDLSSSNSSRDDEVREYQTKISSLEERVKSDGESIAILNKEKLELQAKVDILEKSTNKDADKEDIMRDMVEYRDKYNSVMNGVFGKIASFSLPKSPVSVNLTRKGVHLKNISFVYSGSSESRKGTYRSIMNELKEAEYSGKTDQYLLVDVVSETSVDYVFKMKEIKVGIDWFRVGGSVQPYISKTSLKNVNVLSPGLSYVNDTYFLTIDWERRLTELENSGYKVIMMFGDISNVVGRVFHESFADLGESSIFIHGNAVGSRALITNLRGISNSKESIVKYFDYNNTIDRFFKMVSSTNKCVIVSETTNCRKG